MTETARIGIVTVSDRASRGEYEDRSGAAIRAWLEATLTTPWHAVYRLVPDEEPQIEQAFVELADEVGCSLVLATGGTGPAPRDVTPDVLERVCPRLMPGFGELMRRVSLEQVPTAILSRQDAAIRGRTLFVLLPGKPQAIEVCLGAVFPAIPYCIDLIGGAFLDADPDRVKTFRPKAK